MIRILILLRLISRKVFDHAQGNFEAFALRFADLVQNEEQDLED